MIEVRWGIRYSGRDYREGMKSRRQCHQSCEGEGMNYTDHGIGLMYEHDCCLVHSLVLSPPKNVRRIHNDTRRITVDKVEGIECRKRFNNVM